MHKEMIDPDIEILTWLIPEAIFYESERKKYPIIFVFQSDTDAQISLQ